MCRNHFKEIVLLSFDIKYRKKKTLHWYTSICIYMRSICSVSQKKMQKTWRQWITSIRERKIALNIWHFSHQSMHSIQGKRFHMIVLHVILAYEFHVTHSLYTMQMIGFQCHIIIYWFSGYDFFSAQAKYWANMHSIWLTAKKQKLII